MTRQANSYHGEPLVGYIAIIYRWRIFLTKFVGFSTLAMVIYTLIMPQTFTSKSVLIPTSDDPGVNMMQAMSTSFLGVNLSRGSTEIYLLKAILESRTLRETIVTEYNLQELYEEDSMDEALSAVGDQIDITVTDDNTLEVSFSHTTEFFPFSSTERQAVSAFAQNVNNSIIAELDRINRMSQGTEARAYRAFIEDRYNEISQNLANLEDSLATFQEVNGVIAVDIQLQATVEAAALLEADIIKQEIEYSMATVGQDLANPRVRALQAKLEASKDALTRSFGEINNGASYLLGYNDQNPDLLRIFLRLTREIMIQSEVFAFITSTFEESKLREAQDTPTIVILDQPSSPDMRTAPQRKLLVVTTFILMIVLGLGIVFIRDYYDRIRTEYPDLLG
jgi:capsule polysaccharide export protein KpsE/RkpR